MRCVSSVFCFGALLLTSVAVAQDSSSVSPLDGRSSVPVQTLRKVSVTATRAPEELTAIPATVSVIADEEIERELARDIKDLIRYEPGVSVGNDGTRFGPAGFNIRGIEGNRIAMRIDGIRVNDAFDIGSFSSARRNLVDLGILETVEIVRGPASALYGSDAIGGVVSFVTKDPADVLAGEESALRVRSGYRGDSDTWDVASMFAVGNERLSAFAHYRHAEGAELDNRGRASASGGPRTAPNPQDRKENGALGKIVWRPSDAHAFELTVTYDEDENVTNILSARGRGAGAFANIFVVGQEGEDTQQRARSSLEHTMSIPTPLFDAIEWRVSWQETQVEQRTLEERYSFSLGPDSTVFRDRLFEFDQTTFGADVLARKQFSTGAVEHSLIYGIDLLRTDTEQLRDGRQTTRATGAVTSSIPPDDFPVRDFPKTRTDQLAFYVQDEMALADGALLLTPGVRVDYYDLEPELDEVFLADNPDFAAADLRETSVSPKLGAIWHFTDRLSTYASYARGFRAPPYNDVNIGFTNLAFGYTAIANPDLKPETSDGYELGVRGESDKAFVSLAAFYNDYDDFIESLNFVGIQNGLQVFQSRNLSQAHIYGAEFRGGLWLLDDKLRVRSSLAYARGSGRAEGDSGDQSLNSVDPLEVVLGVAYHPSTVWSIELIGTAVDRHKHVDQTSAQFVPGGYFILDLLAQAQIGAQANVNVGVFNLTDKKCWEWSDVRGLAPTSAVLDRYTRPGINFGASVALRF